MSTDAASDFCRRKSTKLEDTLKTVNQVRAPRLAGSDREQQLRGLFCSSSSGSSMPGCVAHHLRRLTALHGPLFV